MKTGAVEFSCTLQVEPGAFDALAAACLPLEPPRFDVSLSDGFAYLGAVAGPLGGAVQMSLYERIRVRIGGELFGWDTRAVSVFPVLGVSK